MSKSYFDTVREMSNDPELLAAVDRAEHGAEPPCTCGHSLRKHQTRGIPEPRCKRSNCRCRGYEEATA